MRQRGQSNVTRSLNDPAAERMILASLMKDPERVYNAVCDCVASHDFSIDQNKLVFESIEKLIRDGIKKLSILEVISKISATNPEAATTYNLVEYITGLTQDPVIADNARHFAQVIKRLSLTRDLRLRLEESVERISNITGEEKLTEIIGIAEAPIAAFTSNTLGQNFTVVNISDSMDLYVEHLAETPDKPLAISSGFPIWDEAIGGGLRRGGTHVVGGRAKAGKSNFLINVAHYCMTQGIPVLYLDTEMTEEYVRSRLLSRASEVEIRDIEKRKFLQDQGKLGKIRSTLQRMKGSRFFYQNINGRPHEEWLSIVRRWIIQEVGRNADGSTKDCLVVLDYLKTNNLEHIKDFQEWQYLGQVMNDLQNVAISFNIPVLTAVQLNRDGISRTDQGVVSGSDKIIQLCASLSIMKIKSQEDFVSDPETNGDRKMHVIAARFGEGTDDSMYINIKSDLARSFMCEGKTNSANQSGTAALNSTGPIQI